MIKFLPRLAQEGAGVAIAIANHPWFGRQGKPGRSSQVKSGGSRAFEAVCTQAHPGSQITLPALSPGWTRPSAKSVCKRRILRWCSPAYSNRNDKTGQAACFALNEEKNNNALSFNYLFVILRIQLKLNIALLSTVRPSVCPCVRA